MKARRTVLAAAVVLGSGFAAAIAVADAGSAPSTATVLTSQMFTNVARGGTVPGMSPAVAAEAAGGASANAPAAESSGTATVLTSTTYTNVTPDSSIPGMSPAVAAQAKASWDAAKAAAQAQGSN